MNTYKESVDRVVKSLADLILSMGCGIGDDFDLDKFRYDRIVCVADADNDGLHIRSLIKAFLYTWCPGFIESGGCSTHCRRCGAPCSAVSASTWPTTRRSLRSVPSTPTTRPTSAA